MAYNVNHKIIEYFNNVIQDIQHNESVFKLKLVQLQDLINNKIHLEEVHFIKDHYVQIVIMYNTIRS